MRARESGFAGNHAWDASVAARPWSEVRRIDQDVEARRVRGIGLLDHAGPAIASRRPEPVASEYVASERKPSEYLTWATSCASGFMRSSASTGIRSMGKNAIASVYTGARSRQTGRAGPPPRRPGPPPSWHSVTRAIRPVSRPGSLPDGSGAT